MGDMLPAHPAQLHLPGIRAQGADHGFQDGVSSAPFGPTIAVAWPAANLAADMVHGGGDGKTPSD